MKIKVLTSKENKNFSNNQNYIINKKHFLLRYISNIDKQEETKSKILIYLIIFSVLLIFGGLALLMKNWTSENINFYIYLVLGLILLMIFLYILYVIKHIFFYKTRIKKFNVFKGSPTSSRVKIIKNK